MNKYTIVSVGHNCEKYLQAWYDSIVNQTYSNWECVVQLDPSEDNSYEKIIELTGNDKRFNVQYNDERKYCLRNTYECVKKAENDECVIVCMDLDDSFYTPKALEIVNKQYEEKDCWLTYGNYIDNNGNGGYWCRPIADVVWQHNAHRKSVWSSSALRTFKAWLFNKIKKEDFLMSDGEWIKRATDRSFMYPMLEMAGKERVVFIRDYLYLYNVYGQQAPMNDIEQDCLKHILQKTPYTKIGGKDV